MHLVHDATGLVAQLYGYGNRIYNRTFCHAKTRRTFTQTLRVYYRNAPSAEGPSICTSLASLLPFLCAYPRCARIFQSRV